jgi:gliding motility-associated-like protein
MKFSNCFSFKKFLIFCFFAFLLIQKVSAQIFITPQLISSTASYSEANGISLTSSVGEVAVQTFFSSNHYLTQGFQQPLANGLSITTSALNSACLGANNGFAEVQVKSGVAPFQFLWLPGNETSQTLKDLIPGKYIVRVTDARGFSLVDTVVIGLDFDGPCSLHIYTGITPNGDNQNDAWVVDGIEEFPVNHVIIFNRWGDTVWEKDNYNNTTVLWEGNNSKNEKLPDATYFYLLRIDKKVYKGWVELTR